MDCVETAVAERLVEPMTRFSDVVDRWSELAIGINEMARSLGVSDPYPFVITGVVREKLCFVDRVIGDAGSG